jgi:hypothetical protein
VLLLLLWFPLIFQWVWLCFSETGDGNSARVDLMFHFSSIRSSVDALKSRSGREREREREPWEKHSIPWAREGEKILREPKP